LLGREDLGHELVRLLDGLASFQQFLALSQFSGSAYTPGKG